MYILAIAISWLICITRCRSDASSVASDVVAPTLAFTRYSFISRLPCTNQRSLYPPRPPVLATLLQYYCTTIEQYTSPPPISLLYAMHHTILVITILCKGQLPRQRLCPPIPTIAQYTSPPPTPPSHAIHYKHIGNSNIYISICMYVYIIYMHTYMHTHTHTQAHTHTYIYIQIGQPASPAAGPRPREWRATW